MVTGSEAHAGVLGCTLRRGIRLGGFGRGVRIIRCELEVGKEYVIDIVACCLDVEGCLNRGKRMARRFAKRAGELNEERTVLES